MEMLEIWKEFKKIFKEKKIFNEGLVYNESENKIEYIPKELLDILKDSDGQISDSEPIFIEFKNNILGIDMYLYKFLSFSEIIELKKDIKKNTSIDVENLMPFAKLSNKNIFEPGYIILSINEINKKIYKVQYNVLEKFVSHEEFKKDVFAINLKDFLESQIIWHNIRM